MRLLAQIVGFPIRLIVAIFGTVAFFIASLIFPDIWSEQLSGFIVDFILGRDNTLGEKR